MLLKQLWKENFGFFFFLFFYRIALIFSLRIFQNPVIFSFLTSLKFIFPYWSPVAKMLPLFWPSFSSLLFPAAAKSLQSCPTLCNPIGSSPPGSAIPGILQARTLEWVAISFSNAWKWKGKVKSLSRVQLFETPWTAAYQAPPSMGFSRQEYWSGVPLPSPLLFPMNTYTVVSILEFCLS